MHWLPPCVAQWAAGLIFFVNFWWVWEDSFWPTLRFGSLPFFCSASPLPPSLTEACGRAGPGQVWAGLHPSRRGGQLSYSTHSAKYFGMWANPRSVTWFQWRHVFEVASHLHATLLGMVKQMLLWPLLKHDSSRISVYNEHNSYTIFVYNEHDCEYERSICCIWVNWGFFGLFQMHHRLLGYTSDIPNLYGRCVSP